MRVFPSEKVYASKEKLDRFLLRVPLSHLLEGPKTSRSFWLVLKVLITQIMLHVPAAFKCSNKCDLCKNYFRESKMFRNTSTERFRNYILDNMLTANLKM